MQKLSRAAFGTNNATSVPPRDTLPRSPVW